jgi:peroxiredoxin
MAQLRHDYPQFQALNCAVLVVVPNGPRSIARYVEQHRTPYPILSDKGARVAAQYGIDTRHLLRMSIFTPTVLLVDQAGVIRYSNYQSSYIQEPDNRQPLGVLAGLAGEQGRMPSARTAAGA